MHPIIFNGCVFIGFYSVALGHHVFIHRRDLKDANGHLKAGAFAALTHPVTLDASRDFCIHLVVYFAGH